MRFNGITVQKVIGTIGLVVSLLAMWAGVTAFTDVVLTLVVSITCATLIFSGEIIYHFDHFYDDEDYEDEEDL